MNHWIPIFAGGHLTVQRPLLGYPSVVFTGKYADPIPLLQAASDAAEGVGSFGIADPDVVQVQIDVEVRSLQMDNQALAVGQERPIIHLYTTYRTSRTDFDAALLDSAGVPPGQHAQFWRPVRPGRPGRERG